MAKYDGLIIPRSYGEYVNKTDTATFNQMLTNAGITGKLATLQNNIDACKHQYGRLRKANLADIFGTTDVPTIIAYSKNQKDAVCIGDYVTLPAFSFVDDVTGSTVAITTTGNNSRIRVAGNPSPYCGSGDTVNADGILWEFQNCPFLRGMNATNTNSGSYVGSEAHNVLNGAFATALQSVVGSANAIQSTRRLLPTSNNEDYGDWGWYGEKCFLLTEAEVLGFKNVGAKKFQVGNMFQLPIYALDPSAKIKYYNGSRYWWWLATAYSIDSDNSWNSSLFADVGYSGRADWSGAGGSYGVSPAFVIA